MARYFPGDVVLAAIALDNRSVAKARPAVIIGTAESGSVTVCPVSSKPPSDAPCLPLNLSDFAAGGLDLFGESYVMTSRVLTLRCGDVIGKKGRLTAEVLADIAERVPAAALTGTLPEQKKPGRPPH